MTYSENIARLQPSATIAVSTLAKKLAAEGRDIVNLSAGEPDFRTPAGIAEAGVTGIRRGRTRYTPSAGLPELRAAAAAYMTRGTSYPAEAARVVVSAGAKQSLFNACFCLFGPGDEVLIGSPYWTSYPEMVTLARAEPVPVAGSESRGFNLTPDDLEAVATPRTRGLILSTPSNPTGAVYSKAELGAIAGWAGSRGVTLISDEIYQEIYYGEGDRAPGALDLDPDSVGDLVVANGMSKAFAMTGWRVGFSYTTRELAAKMSALQSHVSLNAATPSQVAALEGLTRGEEGAADLARMQAAFRRRRDLVTRLFDELLPDCFYVRPEGAFYLYFRVDHLFDGEVTCAGDLCTRILEEAGVAIVPGEAFGDPRFARMSTASSDEDIEEGVRRMAGVLGG
ncbi:MAG: pyridoxal phosphate-dependent aminotransferase [Gemmatimonadota bacterium]|nr:pyridoxal phosphate-dependent aminotransferase [Gemmatimonadota bacterium]MDE2873147.1 pyridoxal phosphate-dependent aminotransferase [Gemmatimonadota bacterium]